jgi:phosphatidylglycerophosphatase C
MVLALFDFDHTISFKDSFGDFTRYVVGPSKFRLGIACLLPVVVGFMFGIIRAWRAKELMIIYFFGGRDAAEFEQLADTYARQRLPQIVRPIALERILAHRKAGDTVVVVTASNDIWIKGWCEDQGIDLIATKTEIRDGCITGRFSTKYCSGKEKVRRIKERYDLSKFDRIYAYGDNPADKPMLKLAHEKYYRWRKVN